MLIKLSPTRCDDTLSASISGDAITLNGEAYDFGPLPDDATLPVGAVDCPWIIGDVQRAGGQVQLTLLLPHGPNATEAQRFPDDIVDPPNGEVSLPTAPEVFQEQEE